MKVQPVPEAAAAPAARPKSGQAAAAAAAAAAPGVSHVQHAAQEREAAPQLRNHDGEADAPRPKKLSVLEMANNFAQRAEENEPDLLPATAKPTIKWARSDRVLRIEGNTLTKNSPPSPSAEEEYGVAVADAPLSSGVHGLRLPSQPAPSVVHGPVHACLRGDAFCAFRKEETILIVEWFD